MYTVLMILKKILDPIKNVPYVALIGKNLYPKQINDKIYIAVRSL